MDYSIDNNSIISPFFRHLVRNIGWICAFIMCIVIISDNSPLGTYFLLFAYVIISICAINFATGKNRQYYFPIIFIILYIVGYMISFSLLLLNKNMLPMIGFHAIGTFGFTSEEWLRVILVVVCGLSGMICATKLFEVISGRKRNYSSKMVKALSKKKKTYSALLILWVLFSTAVILTMGALGIAKHGLVESRELPFKITGILLYIRNYLIPFLGLFLMDVFVRSGNNRLRNVTIFFVLGFGLLSSIIFYARAQFIFPLFMILLYFSINVGRYNINKRKLIFCYLLLIPVVGAVLFFVSQGRSLIYQGGAFLDVLDININPLDMILFGLYFFVDRVEGLRILFAVDSSAVKGFDQTWAALMSDSSITYSTIVNVFGLRFNNEGFAFGISYGLWGLLYLSKNYFVVFVGTLFNIGLVLFAEDVFRKKGLYSAALWFAFVLGIVVWGNMVWFLFVRLFVIITLTYLLIRFVDNVFVNRKWDISNRAINRS